MDLLPGFGGSSVRVAVHDRRNLKSLSPERFAGILLGEQFRQQEAVENPMYEEFTSAFRLRRKGRWTCALADAFGLKTGNLGRLLSGRWKPDLSVIESDPVTRWMAGMLGSGAKVVGGGLCRQGNPSLVQQPFVRLQLGDTVVNVLPRLLARLSLYSVYRKRTGSLLAALRTRGVEWCREVGIPDADASLCLAGTLSLSFLLSSPERTGLDLLSTVEAESAMGKDGFFHRLCLSMYPWSVNTRKSLLVE